MDDDERRRHEKSWNDPPFFSWDQLNKSSSQASKVPLHKRYSRPMAPEVNPATVRQPVQTGYPGMQGQMNAYHNAPSAAPATSQPTNYYQNVQAAGWPGGQTAYPQPSPYQQQPVQAYPGAPGASAYHFQTMAPANYPQATSAPGYPMSYQQNPSYYTQSPTQPYPPSAAPPGTAGAYWPTGQ